MDTLLKAHTCPAWVGGGQAPSRQQGHGSGRRPGVTWSKARRGTLRIMTVVSKPSPVRKPAHSRATSARQLRSANDGDVGTRQQDPVPRQKPTPHPSPPAQRRLRPGCGDSPRCPSQMHVKGHVGPRCTGAFHVPRRLTQATWGRPGAGTRTSRLRLPCSRSSRPPILLLHLKEPARGGWSPGRTSCLTAVSSCPASERLRKSLPEAPDSEVNLRVSPEHRGQTGPLQVAGGSPHGRGEGGGRARASTLGTVSSAVRLSVTRVQQRIQLAPTTNLWGGQTEIRGSHGHRPRAAPGAPRAGPRAGARHLPRAVPQPPRGTTAPPGLPPQ